MSPRFVLLFFVFLTTACPAQKFAFDYWHEGKLVLDTSDTLRGQVKYNMQDEVIQIQVNNRLETFTARKVIFCEIFDATVKRYRQFYSLPYSQNGTYKTPLFFELLEEGKMTLLSREVLETRTSSSSYSAGYPYVPTYTRIVLVDKYYFLKENGTIQLFTGNKNDFLDMLGSQSDEVQKFIKKNKLNFDNKYDVAQMVEYYNSLPKR